MSSINIITNVNMYRWVSAKIVGTHFALNIVEVVTQANIIIVNSSNLEILPIGPDERVCNSFKGCLVPLYKCPLTSLRIMLSFSNFEVARMNLLKIPPPSFILELGPSWRRSSFVSSISLVNLHWGSSS